MVHANLHYINAAKQIITGIPQLLCS